MDKREARQYICAKPPVDPYFMERRPSFLGRLFGSRSRTSSLSDDSSNAPIGLQRRGSIDPPDVASLTQKLQQVQQQQQQGMKKPATPATTNEFSIFT